MKKPVWRPRCPQLFGQVNPSDPYLRVGGDDGTEVRHDQAIFEYRSTIAREATGRDTRASKAGATGRSQTPAGKPRNTACATAFVRGLGKHLKPIRFRAGTPDPNARYVRRRPAFSPTQPSIGSRKVFALLAGVQATRSEYPIVIGKWRDLYVIITPPSQALDRNSALSAH